MKENLKKLFAIFIFGSLIFIIAFREYKEYRLRKNHKICVGYIEREISTGKGLRALEYKYQYNWKLYWFSNTSIKELKLIHKYFPVAISCDDPSISMMLISPEDFKEFGLPFPDSLNWVIPIIEGK
jgi:hypothetical protein